jgi:hypothetical protein
VLFYVVFVLCYVCAVLCCVCNVCCVYNNVCCSVVFVLFVVLGPLHCFYLFEEEELCSFLIFVFACIVLFCANG